MKYLVPPKPLSVTVGSALEALSAGNTPVLAQLGFGATNARPLAEPRSEPPPTCALTWPRDGRQDYELSVATTEAMAWRPKGPISFMFNASGSSGVPTIYSFWTAESAEVEIFVAPRNDRLHEQLSAARTDLGRVARLLARQAARAYQFFSEELRSAGNEDEEEVDNSKRRIAHAMWLLGEPAIFAASELLHELTHKRGAHQMLMSAMASVDDPATEDERAELILEAGHSPSPQIRYGAASSLSDMRGEKAKQSLRALATDEKNAHVARALKYYGE
jgi:hypothetical protein